MAGISDFLGGLFGGNGSSTASNAAAPAAADPTGMGGLMGIYANPQTAGLLGLAQGLLAASGPSRLPVKLGQALGSGMQGMQQGVGNAFATQMQLMKMRMLTDPLGAMAANSGAGAPAAAGATSSAPVTGAPNVAGLSGLSAGMGAAAPSMSSPQAATAAPAQVGPSIMGMSPQALFTRGYQMSILGMPGGGDMMKLAAQYDPTLAAQMPTDLTKMGTQAGMSPQQIQSANAGGVAKANYIAPTALRTPVYFDPTTGTTKVVDPSQLAAGYGAMYGAQEHAKAQYKPEQMWDPTANGGNGGYVFQTQAQISDAANGNPSAVGAAAPGLSPFQNAVRQVESHGNAVAMNPASGAVGSMQTLPSTLTNPGFGVRPAANNSPAEMQRVGADYAAALQQHYGNNADAAVAYNWGPKNANQWIAQGRPWSKLPPQTQAYVGQVLTQANNFAGGTGGAPTTQTPAAQTPGGGTPMAAQAPFGANTFAQGQAKQMLSRWDDLRDQNANAQTVVSQLQNIAQLAPAAITGAESDRRSYVNGLLSLVGVPGAQDAKTSTDLLDKYSNQIIAKLGQGGLGTDAARSIVSAGNPNAHMTVPAIQEAVRNLTGQYQMIQAKTTALQKYANGNDPAGYTKAETTFDQNADPRIWEWQSIQDPTQRQQYAAGLMKTDPKFGQKIQALEQMGALQ